MTRTALIGIIVIIVVIIGAAYAVNRRHKSPLQTNTAESGDVVIIENFAFTPAQTTVASGTTVSFLNNDNTAHTVSSDSNAFNSSNIEPGQSYRRTFDRPGTYRYHCSLHPSMKGTVVVQ